MRINGKTATTIADGIAVEGGYDLGLFHVPGSSVITGLLGDGIEFTGQFTIDQAKVAKMTTALADDAAVERMAETLATAGGETWAKVQETHGGVRDLYGRGYWRRLARAALGLPATTVEPVA